MLRSLKDLFDALTPAPHGASPAETEHAVQLATAVLLAEVMRSDPGFDARERAVVLHTLRDRFALDEDEGQRLLELGEHAAQHSTDFFSYTSRINEAFEMPEKLRMIEAMWRVAYADGVLAAHENHVLWRIADLLHVPHGAYVNAKMRARAAD